MRVGFIGAGRMATTIGRHLVNAGHKNAPRTCGARGFAGDGSQSVETSTEPRELVAQGDRVYVAGFARRTIKATNKTFEDDWIFATTVRDGRVTRLREYIDTQALARASQIDASGPA